MALELYTGTETVSTTEWSLTTDTSGPDADTTAGTYQPFIDLNAVAAGDTFQIRLYGKARSADTQRLIQEWIITGAQASPLWTCQPYTLMNGWDFTLKKLAGTDRLITWDIRDQTAGVSVALTATAVQAIWDALTSALTTVGSIGKLIVTNLDALISSRMATYTQPTGFLAATFPTTVASTTNITGGTITTVTNLTNAPTAGDLTATMKTSVTTAATAATPVAASVTGAVGSVTGLTASDVAAIKAKTDSLTFTVANQADVNIQSVNDVSITGGGVETTDEWRPV